MLRLNAPPVLVSAERLKKEAMESVGAATTAAMDTVNTGVATVWHNQQQLEAEARQLQQQAQRFNAQTGQWLSTFQSFHQSLKELGDVETGRAQSRQIWPSSTRRLSRCRARASASSHRQPPRSRPISSPSRQCSRQQRVNPALPHEACQLPW